MVIVWNVWTNSKISLLKHEYEVIGLKFIESIDNSKEMIVTLDCSGLGCLWDLDSGQCLHEFKYSNRSRITKIFIQQFPGQMRICLGETDSEASSYRVSVWDIEKGTLILKAKAEEFTDMDLKALVTLPGAERT